jgi:hypothetical protein
MEKKFIFEYSAHVIISSEQFMDEQEAEDFFKSYVKDAEDFAKLFKIKISFNRSRKWFDEKPPGYIYTLIVNLSKRADYFSIRIITDLIHGFCKFNGLTIDDESLHLLS